MRDDAEHTHTMLELMHRAGLYIYSPAPAPVISRALFKVSHISLRAAAADLFCARHAAALACSAYNDAARAIMPLKYYRASTIMAGLRSLHARNIIRCNFNVFHACENGALNKMFQLRVKDAGIFAIDR